MEYQIQSKREQWKQRYSICNYTEFVEVVAVDDDTEPVTFDVFTESLLHLAGSNETRTCGLF